MDIKDINVPLMNTTVVTPKLVIGITNLEMLVRAPAVVTQLHTAIK